MPIEDTKQIVEISGLGHTTIEVNAYLKRGWVMLSVCTLASLRDGEDCAPSYSQEVHYILGWQQPGKEPDHPPDTFWRDQSLNPLS